MSARGMRAARVKRWGFCFLTIGIALAALELVWWIGLAESAGFTLVATFRGGGRVLDQMVAAGPGSDKERFYQSYTYPGGRFAIVSIDPETGEHREFESPIETEDAAWAMAPGPDGNLYIGTAPNAYILRLNPKANTLSVVGRPAGTEKYIWQFAIGADKKLYGCTFPSAKLVRFDFTTGGMEDLGRMDATEQYGRFIAASDDGFVYVGIGSGRAKVVAYEIASGRSRSILPESQQAPGFARVHRGVDGKAYGSVGGQDFRFEKWTAVAVQPSEVRRETKNVLKDGRAVLSAAGGLIRTRDPKMGSEARAPFRYSGKELQVFRLGLGPDGLIYGSGIQPAHLFSLNPGSGDIREIATLGEGEFYSFLKYGDLLLAAAYSGTSPLIAYDPSKPYSPGQEGSGANPRLVHFEGEVATWRPLAMITGPDNRVYVGGVAGYGELGGLLAVWDVNSGQVRSIRHVVRNQSIVSLTVARGQIIGSTTISGGGGSRPSEKEAKLFVWDPTSQRQVFEIVPVAGSAGISELITARNGLVFGISGGSTLFAFDPSLRKVVQTTALPFRGVVTNSVHLGSDGLIRGLATEGIYEINPNLRTARLVARSPEKITAGIAAEGDNLYFASGSKIYRFSFTGQ